MLIMMLFDDIQFSTLASLPSSSTEMLWSVNAPNHKDNICITASDY